MLFKEMKLYMKRILLGLRMKEIGLIKNMKKQVEERQNILIVKVTV